MSEYKHCDNNNSSCQIVNIIWNYFRILSLLALFIIIIKISIIIIKKLIFNEAKIKKNLDIYEYLLSAFVAIAIKLITIVVCIYVLIKGIILRNNVNYKHYDNNNSSCQIVNIVWNYFRILSLLALFIIIIKISIIIKKLIFNEAKIKKNLDIYEYLLSAFVVIAINLISIVVCIYLLIKGIILISNFI